MKRRIISVLFLLAVFLPSVSSASILTDTALGFGYFYKDSIEESSLETLHVVDSVKDFYSPIIYNSITIYSSIGVEVTAVFDGVADVVESIGNTFLLSFALGLENTGNTVGNVAMVYNDTLSKANAEISNLSNVSSSVSGNFFGVLKNIPVSFAETFVFVGQATIDTYTDVIIKAGNGVGSALYEGSVFADDLFEDASEATEKVYSDTEALGNVVIESHDYVVTKTGDSLVELYINSSSKINDVSSVANKKVTDTSREYLASIGSVWTNFIDKLSEPLVPLFMHEAAVAVPGFKNTKAVTKTVDDSTEIISQGNPNAINTNIIQRLSGISRLELNSSLLDMKNEIISIILQNKLSFSESQLEKIYNSIGKTAERTDGGNSGTVTSIDASGGTTGFSFSGGPVTSAGTLTLGGILNIANGGTGTSTSPTYGQLLLGNSSGTYDLVATSSLGITSGGGTVSSVDLSVPTGLSVSGGPITSSGTLAVTLTSGYNIPLTASTTEWNTAYASTTNLTTFWQTPSTRIAGGTGLSWSGNTLNSTGVTSISGLTGNVATSSLGIIESQWITSGSNISYSVGTVGIGTTTPSAKFAITGNGLSTGRAFVVANSSNVDKFIIDDTGAITVTGNITATAGLSFIGGLNSNISFTTTNGNFTVANGGYLRGVNGSISSPTYSFTNDSNTGMYSLTADNLSFVTAGTDRLVIDSSGNVGIATTTPGYALTVAGDISLTGTLRANGNAGTSGMVLQTTGTGVQWVATSSLGITGGGGSLTGTTGQVAYFSGTDTAVGTSSLFIATSGNMGVGTASPSARIHSLSTTEQLRLGYDASNYTKFTVGSASGLTVTPGVNGTSAFNFTKADGTTSILNVDSTNEYVGIGTSASGAKLDVYSATNGLATLRLEHTFGKYGATSPFLRFKYGSDSFLTDIYTGTFNQFTIDHSGSDMYIFTDSNRNMSLQKDGGNLGIGETSPGSILSVSGGGTFGASYDTTASPANGLLVEGNVGIGTITPSAKLSLTQSANTNAGGLWIAETGNTDFRSIFMNTSGVMSFYGGDTGGTLNTATLNAAGEWTNASDRAYKDNINDLSYGLEDLMKLQPRSYTIKNTDLQRVGFIAQEVELVIPEVVAGEEGTKGISYGNLVTVVVKAVQELKIQLDTILLWFADGKFKIQNDICVDDVCVTKEQFKQILLNNNGGTNSPTPTPDEAPDNTGTTTSETVPPEETPDIEPDPVPAVTPTPDSTPIPEISPDPEPVPDEVPPPEETSTE